MVVVGDANILKAATSSTKAAVFASPTAGVDAARRKIVKSPPKWGNAFVSRTAVHVGANTKVAQSLNTRRAFARSMAWKSAATKRVAIALMLVVDFANPTVVALGARWIPVIVLQPRIGADTARIMVAASVVASMIAIDQHEARLNSALDMVVVVVVRNRVARSTMLGEGDAKRTVVAEGVAFRIARSLPMEEVPRASALRMVEEGDAKRPVVRLLLATGRNFVGSMVIWMDQKWSQRKLRLQ